MDNNPSNTNNGCNTFGQNKRENPNWPLTLLHGTPGTKAKTNPKTHTA
jgi:hypothetical protein